MSDLIRREDVLGNIRMRSYYFSKAGLDEAIKAANNAPAVDAVPVVRCKECENGGTCMIPGRVWCDEFYRHVPDDGYCHYGAKMDAKE